MTQLSKRLIRYAIVAQASLGLSGCDTLFGFMTPMTTGSVTTTATDTASFPRAAPKLEAGDKAKIVVYGEDKLSGDYEVDSNGNIVVPLIGTVKAAGLTKKELEQVLITRLRSGQILRNPVVSVDVTAYRPFYVLGEVEKPGEYTYRNGLNVMSAVAVAGGYTYRAKKTRVRIQRAGEKNFTDYDLSPDIPIFPGDLISVPERYF